MEAIQEIQGNRPKALHRWFFGKSIWLTGRGPCSWRHAWLFVLARKHLQTDSMVKFNPESASFHSRACAHQEPAVVQALARCAGVAWCLSVGTEPAVAYGIQGHTPRRWLWTTALLPRCPPLRWCHSLVDAPDSQWQTGEVKNTSHWISTISCICHIMSCCCRLCQPQSALKQQAFPTVDWCAQSVLEKNTCGDASLGISTSRNLEGPGAMPGRNKPRVNWQVNWKGRNGKPPQLLSKTASKTWCASWVGKLNLLTYYLYSICVMLYPKQHASPYVSIQFLTLATRLQSSLASLWIG